MVNLLLAAVIAVIAIASMGALCVIIWFICKYPIRTFATLFVLLTATIYCRLQFC